MRNIILAAATIFLLSGFLVFGRIRDPAN